MLLVPLEAQRVVYEDHLVGRISLQNVRHCLGRIFIADLAARG